MSIMRDSIVLTKKQFDALFVVVKKGGFVIKKLPKDQFLLSSQDNVKWMFRRIAKNDDDYGKQRIELWRYKTKGTIDVDTSMMVMHCFICI